MTRVIGIAGIICGVIGIIIIFFSGVFTIIGVGSLLQAGLWLGIAAIILGIISLIATDSSNAIAAGGIVLGIIDIFIYLIISWFV